MTLDGPQPPADQVIRRAACLCGQLHLDVAGAPLFTLACNCTQCQRRTGSCLGISAYFRGSQVVRLAGDERQFTRTAESGRQVQTHFCPHCGTTLYWTGPDGNISARIGIAAGCFADPGFPPPQLITWTRHQAQWLDFPADIPATATQPRALDLPD